MPKCRKCSNEIAPEDFNVATDRAYCRRCDAHFMLDELLEDEQLAAFDPERTPRHVRVRQEYYGARVCYRKIPATVLGVLPFAAVWSGIWMSAAYGIWAEKGFQLMLFFFVPFALGSVVMIGSALYMLFGRCELRDRENEVELFQGVGIFGRHARIALGDIDSIYLGGIASHHYQGLFGWNGDELRMELKNGKTVKFCLGQPDEVLEYFRRYLEKRRRR